MGRDFWNNSKGKGTGTISSSIYTSSDQRPIVQNWIKLWRKRVGKSDRVPGAYETSTYDAVKLLAKILANAKSLGRKDIADAFLTVQNVETISGTVSFLPEHLPDIYRSKPVLVKLDDKGRLELWGD